MDLLKDILAPLSHIPLRRSANAPAQAVLFRLSSLRHGNLAPFDPVELVDACSTIRMQPDAGGDENGSETEMAAVADRPRETDGAGDLGDHLGHTPVGVRLAANHRIRYLQ